MAVGPGQAKAQIKGHPASEHGGQKEGNLPEIDLHLAVDTTPWVGILDEAFTLLFRADNKGPEDATNVVFTLDLPPELNLIEINGPEESCTFIDGVYHCDVGDLIVNQPKLVEVRTTVQGLGTITTEGRLSSLDGYDQYLGNNTQNHQSTLVEADNQLLANIDVISSASPNPSPPNSPITLRYTIENLGPGTSEDLYLSVDFPEGVDIQEITGFTGQCIDIGQIKECPLGDLNADDIAIATFTLTYPDEALLPVHAHAFTYLSPDPEEANNYGGLELVIANENPTQNDGSITLTAHDDAYFIGGLYTVDIEVENQGPDPLEGASITLEASADVQVHSAYIGETRCTVQDTLTCPVEALPVGSRQQGQWIFEPQTSGPLTLTAQIQDNPNDGHGDNDQSTVEKEVSEGDGPSNFADLEVNLNFSTPILGLPTQIEVEAVNQGPSTTESTTANLRYDSKWQVNAIDEGDHLCRQFDGLISCELGDLEAQASATFSVELEALESGETLLSGEVFSATQESDPFDNFVNHTPEILGLTDGSNWCRLSLDAQNLGQNRHPDVISQTLITTQWQEGSPAQSIDLDYTAPAGSTLLAAYASNGLCQVDQSQADNQIHCELNTLSAGASITTEILFGPQDIGLYHHDIVLSAPCLLEDTLSLSEDLPILSGDLPQTDLSLSVAQSDQPENVGAEYIQEITLFNGGTKTQETIHLSGATSGPGYVLWASAEGNGQCQNHQNRIACQEIRLESQASTTLKVAILGADTGSVETAFTVWDPTHLDRQLENNTGQSTINFEGEDARVNLVLTSQALPDTLSVGETVTLRATLVNQSMSPAQNIIIQGQFDAALNLDVDGDLSDACTVNESTFTCQSPALEAQAFVDFYLPFTANYPGVFTIESAVESDTLEFDTQDNNALSLITVNEESGQGDIDLRVNIALPEGLNAQVGDTLPFTYTAENLSDGQAKNSVFTHPIPHQLAFIDGDDACSPSGSLLRCELGALGGNESVEIQANFRALEADRFTTGVVISSDDNDPNPTNNQAELHLEIAPNAEGQAADLALNAQLSPDPGNVGAPMIWQATLENLGADTAENAHIAVDFNSDATVYLAEADGAQCLQNIGSWTCSWPSLAPNQSQSLTLTLLPTQAGAFTLSAEVWSDAFDPRESNNRVLSEATILEADATTREVDLSLDIEIPEGDTVVGDPFTYQLTIHNEGPDIASSVTLENRLGNPLTFVEAQMDFGHCAQYLDTLTCDVGIIDVNASKTIALTVIPTGVAEITHEAEVYAAEIDLDDGDNIQSITTAITERPRPTATLINDPLEALTVSAGTQDIPMLTARLEAGGEEALKLLRAKIEASGSGLDHGHIEAINFYHDANENGAVDGQDILLATGRYGADDGMLTLPLSQPLTIEREGSAALLITYDIDADARPIENALPPNPVDPAIFLMLALLAGAGLIKAPRWTLAGTLLLGGCGVNLGGIEPPPNSATYHLTLTEFYLVGDNFGEEALQAGLPLEGRTLTVEFKGW